MPVCVCKCAPTYTQLAPFPSSLYTIASLRIELEKALRANDYEKASRLQYGEIPELEKKLASYDPNAQTKDSKLLSDAV